MGNVSTSFSAATDRCDDGIAGHALLCFSTAPSLEVAERLAEAAVSAGLAACVSCLPGATSVYTWQGKTCRDQEVWLMIKTTQQVFPELQRQWAAWHPYDVPELLAVRVVYGLPAYLQWLQCSVGGTMQSQEQT